jgi:hypothetical protein
VSASVLRHEQDWYRESGFDAFIRKPFRLREVCHCLEDLLQVPFDYEPEPVARPVPDPALLDKLTVSPDLLARLKTSAELYSTTELREQLDELAAGNPEAIEFITHLHALNEAGEMEAILEFLNRLQSRMTVET